MRSPRVGRAFWRKVTQTKSHVFNNNNNNIRPIIIVNGRFYTVETILWDRLRPWKNVSLGGGEGVRFIFLQSDLTDYTINDYGCAAFIFVCIWAETFGFYEFIVYNWNRYPTRAVFFWVIFFRWFDQFKALNQRLSEFRRNKNFKKKNGFFYFLQTITLLVNSENVD